MTPGPDTNISFALILKKTVFHLLLFLGIVAGIVGLKMLYSFKFATNTAGINGFLQQKKTDILFIGSSLTRHSINPVILEKITGKNCYLLAYNNLDPIFMNEILQSFIHGKSISRPSVIVMECYPYKFIGPEATLADIRLYNDAQLPLKKNILTLLNQRKSGLKPSDWWFLIGGNNEFFLTYPFTARYINSLNHKGGYVNKEKPGLDETPFRELKDPFLNSKGPAFKFTGLNQNELRAFNEIYSLCKRNNIRLILSIPPVASTIAWNYPYNIAKKTMESYFTDSLEITSILTPGDFSFDNNDASNYVDLVHLSTKGRDSLSAQMGMKLHAMIQ